MISLLLKIKIISSLSFNIASCFLDFIDGTVVYLFEKSRLKELLDQLQSEAKIRIVPAILLMVMGLITDIANRWTERQREREIHSPTYIYTYALL